MVGPQASGKNTFIANDPILKDLVCMSHDDFVVGKWTREKWEIVHEFFNKTINIVIKEVDDLVVNDMYLLPEYRAPVVKLAKDHGFKVCAVVMNTSLAQCHKWNNKRGDRGHYGPIPVDVLNDAYKAFLENNPIDKIGDIMAAEGFDCVMVVNPTEGQNGTINSINLTK